MIGRWLSGHLAERLPNVYGGKNLDNWTKPTETSRISVVRDVADWFGVGNS